MLTSIGARILNKNFGLTLIRYALFGIGIWLVQEGRIDIGQWETISGALLAAATAFMGASESTRDKLVTDGKSIALEKLSPVVQEQLVSQASTKRSRTWIDVLVGK